MLNMTYLYRNISPLYALLSCYDVTTAFAFSSNCGSLHQRPGVLLFVHGYLGLGGKYQRGGVSTAGGVQLRSSDWLG
jgi:hypothetical protein